MIRYTNPFAKLGADMFRKIITQLFIFLLLFMTWLGFRDFPPVWTASRITGPLPLFPQIQIELLNSRDPSLVRDALKETENSLLMFLNPGLAKESWNSRFLFLDLIPGEAPEVVITLSLPPDRGSLFVLQKQNQHYILVYYLNSLLPLTRLEKLVQTGKGDFLVTHEEHNERLGAYSEARIIKLWTWGKNSLQNAWSDNNFWEVNWLNTWQDPRVKERKWFKLVQEASVNYRSQPLPVIILQGQQIYMETPAASEALPEPHQFRTISVRPLEEEFVWNEEWQKFILYTGTFSPNPDALPQKVAVLKDMEKHLEYMALQDKKMFEVVDSRGKVFLVDKTAIKLDP